MTLYSYDGPVLEFDKIIAARWQAQTYAVSEAKARSNLVYQFKKLSGRVPRTRIALPGKIVKKELSEDERTRIRSELA